MKIQTDLTEQLRAELIRQGADLVGIGDLSALPHSQRHGLPFGASVAVKYPREVIRGISELPTPEYKLWYDRLNQQLDELVTAGAAFLQDRGHHAVANTRAQVGDYGADCRTLLPHKTVATCTGLGWIGKSSLLITKQYGSMVRLSSILTDAPLAAAQPITESVCGNCTACQTACPAGAIYGTAWNPTIPRDALFDYQRCQKEAQSRSMRGFGQNTALCGKCIEACPYTKRFLNEEQGGNPK